MINTRAEEKIEMYLGNTCDEGFTKIALVDLFTKF